MSADRHNAMKPLFRALALWLVLTACAVGLLIAVRSGGSTLQLRAQVEDLLSSARASYGAGQLPNAQKDLLQALYLAPAALPRIAEEFGPAVLNMPLLYEAMERSANETDPGSAGAALGLGPSNVQGDGLIEARLALAQGRLPDAKRLFDAYRAANPAVPPDHSALSLFDAGYWPEAIDAARADGDEALALVIEGVQFEAAGDIANARARYEAALAGDNAIMIALQGAARLRSR